MHLIDLPLVDAPLHSPPNQVEVEAAQDALVEKTIRIRYAFDACWVYVVGWKWFQEFTRELSLRKTKSGWLNNSPKPSHWQADK